MRRLRGTHRRIGVHVCNGMNVEWLCEPFGSRSILDGNHFGRTTKGNKLEKASENVNKAQRYNSSSIKCNEVCLGKANLNVYIWTIVVETETIKSIA